MCTMHVIPLIHKTKDNNFYKVELHPQNHPSETLKIPGTGLPV